MAAAQAQAEVQNLLRFLTKDAKIALSDALPKIGMLRKQGLIDAASLVKADHEVLRTIFSDEKVIKQVVNAAKRGTNAKKRGPPESPLASGGKRLKSEDGQSTVNNEDHLRLPISQLSADDLSHIEIETNRAPLVLAFAVVVLKYTMPEQPLSSRLSLAQALVSANSQSKAKSIGILSGNTADEEGWAAGQPKIKVLGRDIAVLRRHQPPNTETQADGIDKPESTSYDTFWGLDLEALRKSNGPLIPGRAPGSTGPPIHTPQAARSYLIRAMALVPDKQDQASPAPKKLKPAEVAAMKENALSLVLKAIELLCESWSSTLSPSDLDSRAWSWYIRVRPNVAQGQAGWGQKGRLHLSDILKLRREQTP